MSRSVRRSSVGWSVYHNFPKRAGGFTSMLLSKPLFHQNISSPLSDYLSSFKYSSSNIPFSDCLSSFNYSSYSSAHFPSNRTYILLEIKIQSPGSFEGDHSRNQSLSISPFLYIQTLQIFRQIFVVDLLSFLHTRSSQYNYVIQRIRKIFKQVPLIIYFV